MSNIHCYDICVPAWIEVKQTEPPLVCCILSRHAVTAVQGSIQGCQAVLLDKRQLSEYCTVIHTRLISLYQQLYRIIKPSLVLIIDCVAGAKKLVEKIKEYNPKIAVFNGKGIYEVFSGEKEFIFGKQPNKIADTDTVRIKTFQILPLTDGHNEIFKLPFLQAVRILFLFFVPDCD